MPGCEAITGWKMGSTLDWRGTYEGKTMVFVSGVVEACEAPHLLIYTTYDPNASFTDAPEDHLRVRYRLSSPRPGVTRLDVTQGDYAKVKESERR